MKRSWPLGVAPVTDSMNSVGAESPAPLIETCGLISAPVPVNESTWLLECA